jgi:hypothetical protein
VLRSVFAKADVATLGLAVAVAALIVALFSAEGAIGVGAVAMVLGGFGIRGAVRTDRGMARSLFALGLGFLAVVIGTFVLGHENGGQAVGERAPSAVVRPR